MVAVRKPKPRDAAGVGLAWEDARHFYSSLDPRAFLPPDPTDTELGQALLGRLLEAADRPDRFIRVADLVGEAVGFITATLHEPADENGRRLMRDPGERHATIDALVVQQSRWRRGVGRALVEAVEAWAIDAGASSVTLTTYANSPVSTNFYKALGVRRPCHRISEIPQLTVGADVPIWCGLRYERYRSRIVDRRCSSRDPRSGLPLRGSLA